MLLIHIRVKFEPLILYQSASSLFFVANSDATVTTHGSFWRSPIPASAPLTFSPIDNEITNASGIATRPLVEFQRLLACSICSSGQTIDNNMKKGFSALVASSNVSARLSLILKTNGCVRTVSGLAWLYASTLSFVAFVCCMLLL